MEERHPRRKRGELLPEGKYKFTFLGRSERFKTEKSFFQFWNFSTVVDGEIKQVSFFYFPWETEELKLALGGYIDEETNEIAFDEEKAVEEQREIFGEVKHEPDYTDKTKMRMKLKNPKSVEKKEEEDLPF